MAIPSIICKKLQQHYFLLGVVLVFIGLLFRNSGIYPVVFGDEYVYSKFSRLLPLTEASIPGYIYLTIYRATNIFGDGFLDCARILNALFFVAATPFIYLIAKRVCTRDVATLVTLLSLLGPINSYTAYYMPESLYFLSFWVFTWYVLRLDNSSGPKSWCLAGIILGFSALIKPHALFLLPAAAIYSLYVSGKGENRWMLRAIRNASILVGFTLFTKFLIGYLIAGTAGVTFFGPVYTSIADSTASNSHRYLRLATLTAESFKGHALALSLMFSVPVVVALVAAFRYAFFNAENGPDRKIAFFAVAVLLNLILVACLFTAAFADAGPYETNERLHMRYYNFAFPLLLVIAASQLSLESITTRLRWRAVAAFPVGLAIIYAVYTHLTPYTPYFVDSPELRGFTVNSTIFYLLGGISFFTLALWVYSTQAGAKYFVYLFLPLAVVFSTYYVTLELRQRLVPDVYDKAGIITRQYLSNEELSKVVIVGSESCGLFRSLFYLDNPQASVETIPPGVDYDLAMLPAGKEWVLVIGDHSLPDNTFFQLHMNGFSLARISGTNTIDFRKSAWPGVVSSLRGLYSAEAWGTWSSGDVVTLEFSAPLPDKFTVHLIACAFGPNVGKEVVAHIGDSAISFTLGASAEERVLEFSNPKRLRTIRIDIPSSISPKKLGLGDDDRSLGIAFTELQIVPI